MRRFCTLCLSGSLFLIVSSSLLWASDLFEAPLLDCSGLPCVDVSAVNGRTLRLLIDTGNNNSYLDTQSAQEAGISLSPLQGSNGSAIDQVQRAVLPQVKINGSLLGDVGVMVYDLSDTKKKGQFPDVDGALTFNAFRERIFQLDYRQHKLRFSKPLTESEPCPGRCADLLLQHFGNSGPPILLAGGFAVDGKPVQAQIDTLFTGTMLIYTDSVKKLDLKKQSKAHHKDQFPFTGGGVKMARGEAESESFEDLPLLQNAPLYFAAPEMNQPDGLFDATVGIGLLQGTAVTFNMHDRKLWIEK